MEKAEAFTFFPKRFSEADVCISAARWETGWANNLQGNGEASRARLLHRKQKNKGDLPLPFLSFLGLSTVQFTSSSPRMSPSPLPFLAPPSPLRSFIKKKIPLGETSLIRLLANSNMAKKISGQILTCSSAQIRPRPIQFVFGPSSSFNFGAQITKSFCVLTFLIETKQFLYSTERRSCSYITYLKQGIQQIDYSFGDFGNFM